ncbi:hypothetical protein C1H46_022726 [Malus baccata]|uniref:Cdc6 C-terminal domain-containing protein n=1 Tax=Malus baccata TaxID=106549 RepID=A0A540LZH3_MALBA|nr:hypothetical protein C1H46_022726 [Malus baccata]
MASALSKTFKSPVGSSGHHTKSSATSTGNPFSSDLYLLNIILCSAVRLFRGKKKDSTVAQLNKSYIDICKTTLIPPVGIFEFSSMCRVLNDQGLLKLGGQSRDEKLKRVTMNAADEADITFALQLVDDYLYMNEQGIRFFRNCLQ